MYRTASFLKFWPDLEAHTTLIRKIHLKIIISGIKGMLRSVADNDVIPFYKYLFLIKNKIINLMQKMKSFSFLPF